MVDTSGDRVGRTVVMVMPDAGPRIRAAWPPNLLQHSDGVRLVDPNEDPHMVDDADIVITLPGKPRPVGWDWIPQLVAALDRPGVAAAVPLQIDADRLITGPLLAGHPPSVAMHLDGARLPDAADGPVARRVGVEGDVVLAAESMLVMPEPRIGTGPAWNALAEPVTALPDGGLRWAVDIAAPATAPGRKWGDWHFAWSLAAALRRCGQFVQIDHPETRGRAGRREVDVVLTLRGLHRVEPTPGPVNLMWVISHPDDVVDDEVAAYDRVFAAGAAWAEERGVDTLLQCTDFTPPDPARVDGDSDDGVLFVGNARGGTRPAVSAALEAGVPVEVVGALWDEPGVVVTAESVPNQALPARYADAGVVLCDHHTDMRERGFVSNRVFDVLAVGGRLLTDDVAGLTHVLGPDIAPAVQTWRTPDDIGALARAPFGAWPSTPQRLQIARRIVAEHSFDARARTLVAAARAAIERSDS